MLMLNQQLIVAALLGDGAAVTWLDVCQPDWRENICAIIPLTSVVSLGSGTDAKLQTINHAVVGPGGSGSPIRFAAGRGRAGKA